jgi:hypothetical protein
MIAFFFMWINGIIRAIDEPNKQEEKKRIQGLRCYQETEQWKEVHSSSEKEKEWYKKNKNK